MLLPLGIHSIIFNTAPFQSSLLGLIILKERVQTKELVKILIAFVGVIIIGTAKPEV
ncbi:MAG: hypothetical protein ACKO96_44220 [Flammeovirgaceae bacterium]